MSVCVFARVHVCVRTWSVLCVAACWIEGAEKSQADCTAGGAAAQARRRFVCSFSTSVVFRAVWVSRSINLLCVMASIALVGWLVGRCRQQTLLPNRAMCMHGCKARVCERLFMPCCCVVLAYWCFFVLVCGLRCPPLFLSLIHI